MEGGGWVGVGGHEIFGESAPRYENLTIARIYPVKYILREVLIVKDYVLRRNPGFIPPSFVFFLLRTNYFMDHFKGKFKRAKTFLIP